MKREVYASKKSDEWATPTFIYEQVTAKNYFDPCPLNRKENGLEMEWGSKNYVNPPYSQLSKWIEKAIEEHSKGKEVVLLIPARTDTKAFKRLFEYGATIEFITGRLHFNESNPAPFPSMIVKLRGHGLTRCTLIKRSEITL